ncbi:rhodanese-like domain-containing protein [Ancylobacter vacuolatus]|uniref:Rhodanese-related sulfurtransferase n=1 Tax=Ancylobacter vacuolatus TaxID=223389 RepID=A0ABU0DHY2_9HYPH|nr:rhodanese-like domain-containing protein [Ancylobacter vacuolatus]MDQ0348035.1 rhodanese-related sulfurtransferase [Ancylobacter vacuolatus]
MSVASVTAAAAKARLHEGEEIAFLDVREAAAFGQGHPLFAVPCPFSRLEAAALALVPRADCPVLLIDDGDGLAEKAARRLAACGYTEIVLIAGGLPAWDAAGFGVFAGVNVPSKTLGELLEHDHHPAMIDAATLARWQREGRAHAFFDARPPAEYAKMRIEGARCVPNGELAHRVGAAVPDTATPIVITCAGRTRGIVGALTLRAIGVPNPVYALENGTQGWALAGLQLDRGAQADPLPELDPSQAQASRDGAARLIAAAQLSTLTPRAAQTLLQEAGRTTFLFDLRNEAERAARPVPGAIPALAGQLIQATDQYVGVRHGRLILIDDTGLRAALAALFLRALGFEPHVLALDNAEEIDIPAVPTPALKAPAPPPAIDARAAWSLAQSGVPVLDLRASSDWESWRLDGARWVLRGDLPGALAKGTRRAILLGDATAVAAATCELQAAGIASCWLQPDLDSCAQAGWPVDRVRRRMGREAARDRVWFVHDRHDGNAEASRQYLAWEMGLIDQLDESERAAFGWVPIAPA